MSFHDVLFPVDISYGSSGGPGFNTTVLELASGHEQRNINWSEVRAEYDVSYGIKTPPEMEKIMDFFYARQGKAYGFRYKDWTDYKITDQVIGIGDGSKKTFQVYKRYEKNGLYPYDRPIRKILAGSYSITKAGVVQASNLLNVSTGILTFATAPTLGQEIRVVNMEFHVPVRFDIDKMDVSYEDYNNLSWPSIPLVELKTR